MNFFINAARQNKDFSRLEKYLNGNNPLPALVTGVSAIHKAHFIAGLLGGESAQKTVVVMKNESDAVKLCADINMLLGVNAALLCPEKEMILADTEASSKEYEHKRINALSALIAGKCRAIVCSASAAIQLTIPPEELQSHTFEISCGDEIDKDELVQKLISAGYSRASQIDGNGQFSVRGGIVDVFPPSSDVPFRMEFFGDEIDSLGQFDLERQRRTESLDKIVISPARETLFESGDVLCEKIEALSKKLRGKSAE